MLRPAVHGEAGTHSEPPTHRPPALAYPQATRPGARPVVVVDIPGHPRVRGALEGYAARAAGVVFVVDSVDFMPRKIEVAE